MGLAAVVGLLNAVVAVVALNAVDALTEDELGWFAYAPLNEVVEDPRFPWEYVVLPVSLLVLNLLVVPLLARRRGAATG